ncbi:MAG: UDP-glucose/GDP-mannose dehydrogenase family protein [Dehalococcoidia bacterium]|nr:UDP-glucose/GDP-mannose dehydrogenase family protein [Dehalococcoidia bacterium]
MKISVIGAGYVGLVTAAALASKGHNVIVIDTDKARVTMINQKRSPIFEEGLDDMLSNCIESGHLRATGDYEEIMATDITLICVGTPSNPDGSMDLSCITESARDIGRVLGAKSGRHTVVVRSTVVPGTTKKAIIPALEEHSRKKEHVDFDVAVNPEFLQEGRALHGFFNPDRIIIGEEDQRAGDMVKELYESISAPIVRMDITTAEMVKFASNAFLATKISFINDIGNICRRLGIDVYDVVRGISFDYRIGDRFLNAGIGFGGSCLPKDLKALVHSSRHLGYQAQLLESVLEVNRNQILNMLQMVEGKLGSLKGKTICVLGLAFKPNTDDIRNAPALEVIRLVMEKGASVKAYDPLAMSNAKRVLSEKVKYCRDAKEAVSNCDCILVLTEWDEFRDESLYHGKVVFDGRRVLDPGKARTFCDYCGICW